MKQWIALLFIIVSVPLVIGAAPSVGTVTAPASVVLNSGSSKSITCNATLTDLDGFGNITNANATFFDTSQSGVDDNNNRYSNSSCNLTGGSGNTTNAVCGFGILYYANPAANWECNITATDGVGSGNNGTNSTTVEELKALSVTSLSFSNSSGNDIPLGNTSTQQSLNITNLGNINITLQVNGTAMGCDIGTIAVNNLKYNITSGFGFSNGIGLTATPVNVSNFIVAQRTDDASPSINYLYWLLQMPGNGIGGSCTGTISVNAN